MLLASWSSRNSVSWDLIISHTGTSRAEGRLIGGVKTHNNDHKFPPATRELSWLPRAISLEESLADGPFHFCSSWWEVLLVPWQVILFLPWSNSYDLTRIVWRWKDYATRGLTLLSFECLTVTSGQLNALFKEKKLCHICPCKLMSQIYTKPVKISTDKSGLTFLRVKLRRRHNSPPCQMGAWRAHRWRSAKGVVWRKGRV